MTFCRASSNHALLLGMLSLSLSLSGDEGHNKSQIPSLQSSAIFPSLLLITALERSIGFVSKRNDLIYIYIIKLKVTSWALGFISVLNFPRWQAAITCICVSTESIFNKQDIEGFCTCYVQFAMDHEKNFMVVNAML